MIKLPSVLALTVIGLGFGPLAQPVPDEPTALADNDAEATDAAAKPPPAPESSSGGCGCAPVA